MAKFLAVRIIDSARDYKATVTQYPQHKAGIDAYLTEKGYQFLIVEV